MPDHAEDGVSEIERVLRKIRAWMDRQATADEASARKSGQFTSLVEAYVADAANLRAMIREIDAALNAEGRP